ncbi:MAG: phage tail protein I, partial [Nitrospirae bacterium]|nr:phage tail protein I [Nitrospirota bacterium]
MVKTKDLLPPNLQGDKNLEGLCEAADKVFAIEDKLDKLLVYLIDEVSADVLPFLAWQFHVEGWELSGTESEKRTLIKNSIELHRYKGTPWAIENALKSISIDGK